MVIILIRLIQREKAQTLRADLKAIFSEIDNDLKIPIITIGHDPNKDYDAFNKKMMTKVSVISNKHSKLKLNHQLKN